MQSSGYHATEKCVLHLLSIDSQQFAEGQQDDVVCYSMRLPETTVVDLLQGWREGKDMKITLPQMAQRERDQDMDMDAQASAAANTANVSTNAHISISGVQYKLEWNAESTPENCWIYREVFPDHAMYPYAQIQGRYLGKTTVQQPGSQAQATTSSMAPLPGRDRLSATATTGAGYGSTAGLPHSSSTGSLLRMATSAGASNHGFATSPVTPAASATPPPSQTIKPTPSKMTYSNAISALPSTAKGVLRKLRDAGNAKESRKRTQPPKPIVTSVASDSDREIATESKSIPLASTIPQDQSTQHLQQSQQYQQHNQQLQPPAVKRVRLSTLQAATLPMEIANQILRESNFYVGRDGEGSNGTMEGRPVIRTREDLLAMAADTNRLNNIYDMLRNWLQRQAKIIQDAESRLETILSENSNNAAIDMKLPSSNLATVKDMLMSAVSKELNIRAEPIAEAHAACKLLLKELQCRGEMMKQYLSGAHTRASSTE